MNRLTPYATRSDAGSSCEVEHTPLAVTASTSALAQGLSTTLGSPLVPSSTKRTSLDSQRSRGDSISSPLNQDKQAPASGGKTKQFFEKLFKKKDGSIRAGDSPGNVVSGLPTHSPIKSPLVSAAADRLLSPLSPTPTRDPRNGASLGSAVVAAPQTQVYAVPTFGLYPTIASAADGSLGEGSFTRTMGYTWTVKQWAAEKGGDLAAAGSWAAMFAVTDKLAGGRTSPVRPVGDVVFEWSRGKGKGGRMSRVDASKSLAPATSNGSIQKTGNIQSAFNPNNASQGFALEVPSAESSRPASITSSHLQEETTISGPSQERLSSGFGSPPKESCDITGAGDESDPEDSETPWVCRLYLPKQPGPIPFVSATSTTAQAPTSMGNGSAESLANGNTQKHGVAEGESGIVVATLYPAPHHPRIVSQIKFFPGRLPISTGLVKPSSSIITPDNHDASTQEGQQATEEIRLTQTDIREVVCVTALWLVAREDFAGITKKKKSNQH